MAGTHIISIVGGKGGVGKSTFAVNFAITTAIDTKAKVCLVDIDPRACGDIALLLGIKSKRTLLELGQHEGKFDPNLMNNYVSPHSSGIHYIPSVLEPEQMSQLEPQQVARAFQLLQSVYNYIIVDMGSDIESQNVKALEVSSMIIVATLPEILVLHHTRKVIEKVQNLLFPPELIKLVVNRFAPTKGISPQVIQNNLKKQILGIIPEDEPTTVAAMAKAQPFILAAPRTEITKAYFTLFRTIQQQQLLEKLSQIKKPTDSAARLGSARNPKGLTEEKKAPSQVVFDRTQMRDERPSDQWSALKQRIHKQLIETMDLKKVDTETGNDPKKKAVLREKQKRLL